jgi:hypothetical protein
MNSRQNKGVKTSNRTSFLRRNVSVHHTIELNTWKHVIDNISNTNPSNASKTRGRAQVTQIDKQFLLD